jgi:hypothetical protein
MVAAADAAPSTLGGDSTHSRPFPGGVDYAALWRQLDAESARVVVVDLDKRAVLAGRALGDSADGGSAGRFGSDVALERLFPGATGLIDRWRTEGEGGNGDLASHGLSPRQWVYFWRVDAKVGLLVVVHHRYGRSALSAGDSAFIRVLGEHWLAPELQAMGVGRAAVAPWNRVDRRARASAPAALWGALGALAVAAGCGLWLLLSPSAPPLRAEETTAAELQRLAKLSDDTLARSLSIALAGKDYGEAQEALAAHLALRHFEAAAVLNERKLVIAHAGFQRPPTVGQPLPEGMVAGARRFRLEWTGNTIGELVTVQKPSAVNAVKAVNAETTPPASGSLGWLGALVLAASMASGALLWRHIRQRYR